MQGCDVTNFLGFSVPQKWLPYTPGLNPWIYLFGQFWRQRSLLNNPKVWSHSDNHSFRNGKKLTIIGAAILQKFLLASVPLS